MGEAKSQATQAIEALLETEQRPLALKRLAKAQGIDVSLERIYDIKKRSGGALVNVDASEFLPWPIRREHRNHSVAMRLRDLARIMRKPPLEIGDRRYRLVKNLLVELKETDSVIDYDPSQGFIKVPRRYADNHLGVSLPVDTGWIRDPSLKDDGSSRWTDQPEG